MKKLKAKVTSKTLNYIHCTTKNYKNYKQKMSRVCQTFGKEDK